MQPADECLNPCRGGDCGGRIAALLLMTAAAVLSGGVWQQAGIAAATTDRAIAAHGAAMQSRRPQPYCTQGGVRIDQPRPRTSGSSTGMPPPRLRGGPPAQEATAHPAESATVQPVPATPVTPRPAAPPPPVGRHPVLEADQELAAAQREYAAAFSHYTTLVTTGGEGNVEQARERYRRSYERLKALKRARGIE